MKQLRFNGQSIPIHARPTNVTNDIYKSNEADSSELDYVGNISHSFALKMVEDSFAGTDKALEQLQQSMSKYEQEREANK
jgi:hypothetical protein